MNTKILVFPLAVVASGCGDLRITDPSVKACRESVYDVEVLYPNGRIVHDTLIVHADSTRCRKAA